MGPELLIWPLPGTERPRPLRRARSYRAGPGRPDLALLLRAYGEVARAELNARGDGPPLSTGALGLNLQTCAFAVAPGSVGLVHRIASERARRLLAQAALAQAQELVQRTFAHDPKTPLNAVHGFAGPLRMRLFEPLQRLHGEQDFEGTGLGSSLVRRIVEHHDGDVRLHSQPGVGTTAEFTLQPPAAAGAAGGSAQR